MQLDPVQLLLPIKRLGRGLYSNFSRFLQLCDIPMLATRPEYRAANITKFRTTEIVLLGALLLLQG